MFPHSGNKGVCRCVKVKAMEMGGESIWTLQVCPNAVTSELITGKQREIRHCTDGKVT